MIDISVIIPFRNSVETLPRLFDSIPVSNNVEIILVENSDTPLSKVQIGINRNYTLLNARQNRYAGGARNIGVYAASGKWLIFADADDFFSTDAFEVFGKYINSEFDLIYFGCNSVFDDTLQQGDRHETFNSIVAEYVTGCYPEMRARLYMVVPWAKMIRRALVDDNHIKFDEVIAANDVYFSTLVGYYCKNFHADSSQVYIVTIRKGSLVNRWNLEILHSRYIVGLRRNKFLKNHGLSKYQVSVMIYLYKALKKSPICFVKFILEAIKYRQNIFIGIRNWIKTFIGTLRNNKSKKRYIVNEV